MLFFYEEGFRNFPIFHVMINYCAEQACVKIQVRNRTPCSGQTNANLVWTLAYCSAHKGTHSGSAHSARDIPGHKTMECN